MYPGGIWTGGSHQWGSAEPTETVCSSISCVVIGSHTNGALRSRLKPFDYDLNTVLQVAKSHQWGSAEPTETSFRPSELARLSHTNGALRSRLKLFPFNRQRTLVTDVTPMGLCGAD